MTLEDPLPGMKVGDWHQFIRMTSRSIIKIGTVSELLLVSGWWRRQVPQARELNGDISLTSSDVLILIYIGAQVVWPGGVSFASESAFGCFCLVNGFSFVSLGNHSSRESFLMEYIE